MSKWILGSAIIVSSIGGCVLTTTERLTGWVIGLGTADIVVVLRSCFVLLKEKGNRDYCVVVVIVGSCRVVVVIVVVGESYVAGAELVVLSLLVGGLGLVVDVGAGV